MKKHMALHSFYQMWSCKAFRCTRIAFASEKDCTEGLKIKWLLFNYVIGVLTGFVIDHEVLSNFCHNCAQTEKYLGKESQEFRSWCEGNLHFCHKNYEGISGGMEVEIALKLWRRS